MKIIGLVAKCEDCPNRRYYSGGVYECVAAEAHIPPAESRRGGIPAWCPLADYPASEMSRLESENAALRQQLAEPR